MAKKLKKIIGAAAPLAALIPGIGLPLSIAIGAGGGLLAGGGLKGALLGGIGAAGLGGGAGIIGKGLGLSGAAATGAGGAALGAAGGALSGGGLKGALLGAAAGGLGGYASSGGFGTAAGTPLANGVGPTQGSGILGSITQSNVGSALTKAAGNLAGTGIGGSSSAYGGTGNIASNVLSSALGIYGNEEAEDQLLASQDKAYAAVSPYLNAKFEPGDLTQDPGYQFRLAEGEKALSRNQAAKGNFFSGAALKEAQNFGQGLADQTYNDAYQRFLQQNQQNLGAAGMATGIFDNQGNIKANSTVNNTNSISRGLSGILGGGGFGNTGQSFANGIDPMLLQALLNRSSYA